MSSDTTAVANGRPAKPIFTATERGIPSATFIEDLEDFLGDEDPMKILESLRQLCSKYQFMESSLVRKKQILKEKLPSIRKTLEMVQHLEKQQSSGDEPLVTNYKLSDNVYAEAKIAGVQSVYLWLGANVMVEYAFDEAKTLLQKNIDGAVASIQTHEDDINFLRDQITTSEVNIARVHNHIVTLQKAGKYTAPAAARAD
eukprot:GILI01015590.1.p1 GENE.GILI01015590.1~~GILI01015590.1.p1  ORF type:complete len:215 (-),score=51.56 GILI01015590.1:73-672(-)